MNLRYLVLVSFSLLFSSSAFAGSWFCGNWGGKGNWFRSGQRDYADVLAVNDKVDDFLRDNVGQRICVKGNELGEALLIFDAKLK